MPALAPDEVASRGVRRVALELLANVRRERSRLAMDDDPEALHDFRVAIRRLRSWLRSMREDLAGSRPRRVRALLREFAATSNAGRDAEVLLAWVAEAMHQLPERHRSVARWLMRQQHARGRTAGRKLQRVLDESFDDAVERLERRLRRYRITMHLDGGPSEPTLAQRIGELGREQGAQLREFLRAVQDVNDDAAIHAARIAGKRLRYLLEPLAGDRPSLQPLIQRLKGLQDALGAVHDAHVWGEALHHTLQRAADVEGQSLRRVAAGGTAATRRSSLPSRAGLMALAGLMHQHASKEFEAFRAEWIENGGSRFFADLDAAMAVLAGGGSAPTVEIERKYLLRKVPPRMPRGRILELHQGYLPGERIIERVRKTTVGRRSTYARTIKFGGGVTRTEIEEPVTREFFEQVWPLTAGRRVLKRRHEIAQGKRTWEIDIFSDRELVLAEIELSVEDEDVSIPGWMARYVVREVTNEAEYLNYNLAT